MGKSIKKKIINSVSLDDIINQSSNLIWTYLFYGGYLTFDKDDPLLNEFKEA